MCRIGDELRSGKLPAVLYADDSTDTTEMRTLLKDAGAQFEEEDAKTEALAEPILVVDGGFFNLSAVREILQGG